MRYARTINGHHGNHYVEAAAFWVLAGIIVAMAFGDFLAVLAIAFAVAAAISWSYRALERRWERKDAGIAPVRRLRPALDGRADPEPAPAHVSWRGPKVA